MSKVYDLLKTTVFAVTDPNLITVDFAELERRNAENRAALDAANAAKRPLEDNWRGELEELDRRLKYAQTEQQAQSVADGEVRKHKDIVKSTENELKYLRSLLKEPGLLKCRPLRDGKPPVSGDTCDVCLFNRKIESLEGKLLSFKEQQQISIRRCGATIKNAAETDKLRPRWEELKKRANKIDTARKVARGLQHPDGDGFRQEPITSGDTHRMKSRHLRWEP